MRTYYTQRSERGRKYGHAQQKEGDLIMAVNKSPSGTGTEPALTAQNIKGVVIQVLYGLKINCVSSGMSVEYHENVPFKGRFLYPEDNQPKDLDPMTRLLVYPSSVGESQETDS